MFVGTNTPRSGRPGLAVVACCAIAYAAGTAHPLRSVPLAAAPVPPVPAANVDAGDAAAVRSGPAYPADVIRVVDGDTFEARVHIWPGVAVSTKVRLRGIDAPELGARCAEERVKAEAARAALARLLSGGAIRIAEVANDKYGGRVLADAATPRTPSVAAALVTAGLARPYSGGRRHSWCDESGRVTARR